MYNWHQFSQMWRARVQVICCVAFGASLLCVVVGSYQAVCPLIRRGLVTFQLKGFQLSAQSKSYFDMILAHLYQPPQGIRGIFGSEPLKKTCL